MNDVYHFPPDLFDLLVQTIPLLNRSKKSVLTFFNGAGIGTELYRDISTQVNTNPDSINKYEICRSILERINQDSDKYLRQRREVLKRIVEFEAFSSCWESDQYKAKGLVADIQKIINVKDSFTRMKQEREKEVAQRQNEYLNKVRAIQSHNKNLAKIKKDLFSLFTEVNQQKRGKLLEIVLNAYFKEYKILVRDDFKRIGEHGEGIVEQIDGIIEVDNDIFLVEMKWKKEPIGPDDIFAHLGRIYHRTQAHGIFVSASGYTPAAIEETKNAFINNALLILLDLSELTTVIEQEDDFLSYLRERLKKAIIEKKPYK